jgi:hypothetical protein
LNTAAQNALAARALAQQSGTDLGTVAANARQQAATGQTDLGAAAQAGQGIATGLQALVRGPRLKHLERLLMRQLQTPVRLLQVLVPVLQLLVPKVYEAPQLPPQNNSRHQVRAHNN